MKNIRCILIGASAALALMATPGANAASPRQTPDPVAVSVEQTLCSQSACAPDPNAIQTVANAPGAPRQKADPSELFVVTSAQPDADVVNGMGLLAGEPRMKPDFAPAVPSSENEAQP